MKYVMQYVVVSVASLWVIGAQPAYAHARGPEVAPRDYQLYMDWMDGRQDPRLAGLSDDVKRVKIAKTLGVSAAELKQVVDRIAPLAPTLARDTERAIASAGAETALKARVLEVHVDAEQGHVVAGFKWRCGDSRDVEKEASYAAWATAEGGPVVKTLVLWCVDEHDTKLFSATIGRTAFERINKAGIERFAASRYIKLFEEVKRGPHT